MGKKVDWEQKSVNVGSWSLPICMQNMLSIVAINSNMCPSQIVKRALDDYFKSLPMERFIYPGDAEFEKVIPKSEGRYTMPLFN